MIDDRDAAARPTQASVWNIANAVTMARIALVPVFGVVLLREGGHDTDLRLLAAAIFLFAAITDRLDGELARRRNLITDFGKIADPIADKALVGMALVGLSVIGVLPWWVTIVIAVREIGVTLLRFFVIRHGVIAASRGGKLKTVLQIAALALFIVPISILPNYAEYAAWVVMIVALIVTVVTGLDYVVKAIQLVNNGRAERNG